MARPRKSEAEQTVPVSCRLKRPGVTRIDAIAGSHYGGVRTDAVKGLLQLGVRAWDKGERPTTSREQT
jgi:hypothetical protein